MVFVPKEENWSLICFETVSPTATIITTAITPITMPKTVKKERILFPLMDNQDSLKISFNVIFMPIICLLTIFATLFHRAELYRHKLFFRHKCELSD